MFRFRVSVTPHDFDLLSKILMFRYLIPDQPSRAIPTEFIRTGKLPAARSQEFVSIYSPGMQVGPIADRYEVRQVLW